ncbi:membrane protein YdfJ [Arthrobacter sp. Hiyo4]|nr:membrane protein YdfJ [Arthrobacter sp. Hiyo4]
MAAGGATPAMIEAQLGAQKAALAQGKAQLEAGTQELQAAKAKLDLGKRQAEASAGIRVVSADGQAAVAQVQFNTSINALTPAVRQQVQDIAHETSSVGVTALASKEITEDISELFGTAEIIGIGVAALVLILMLGSLIAAGLPLLMAVIGVGVGVGITFALSGAFEMSSISPMLALMLGLAVGIDYSLFIVNRHRTQLLAGMDSGESVARATGTSGNAVLFAGLTVIIALAALVVPGLPFLSVMGLAAAGTVAVAVLVALTLTPALLSLIGRRIISRRAWAKAHAHNAEAGHEIADQAKDEEKSTRGWGGLVTRHPVVALVAGVLLLGRWPCLPRSSSWPCPTAAPNRWTPRPTRPMTSPPAVSVKASLAPLWWWVNSRPAWMKHRPRNCSMTSRT